MNEMKTKTKHVNLRMDPKALALLQEASTLSGATVSELIRRGALKEAVGIISSLSNRSTKEYNAIQQERTES